MHTVYRLGRGFSSWGTTPLFRGSFSTLPIKQAFQTPVSFNRVASSVFARQYSSPTSAKPPHPSESFLSGNSSVVLEEMYENWRQDPNSVHSSWSEFFRSVEGNLPPGQAIPVPKRYSKFAQASSVSASVATAGQYNAAESLRIFLLVRAYRVLGHFLADLDPLHLQSPNFMQVKEEYTRDLDPKTYGFTEADMDREFYVGEDLPGNKPVRTLREIINLMKTCYCGKIGVQYMHSASPFLKSWIRERFESGDRLYNFSREEKLKIYANLAKAELFEEFLNKKFQQAKRFGLNGGEALIPGLEALVERAAQHNIGSVVFGMPHRGRLSVMANTLNKPLYQIFNEFKMDKEALDMGVQGSGDVKYHLGTSSDRNFDGRDIHMSMTANPSHLEAVNPVVEGKCRAKQEKRGQVDFKRALSVLIHGDAAFAGQGVVGETLELSGLEDFTTGGTVHVIVNNQIGFTTVPKFSRSSPYPSEIAKANGAPVFHVNGDDPEAVVHTMKLAMDFREQFHNDVVVDIYCYRRFGHNELDEPRFTQPQMYQVIDKHDSALPIYRKQLLSQGVCTEEELKKIEDDINSIFAEGYNARENYKQIDADWLECNWKGFKGPQQRAKIQKTGVALDVLQELGSKLTHVPAEYNIHPKLQKRLSNQQEMIKTGHGVDWALGEALAFGSLLREGYDVRLSGQDCERGTFSHRHSVLHCQTSGRTYTPLEHLHPSQGYFNVINSSLSENAVLGFEHGYSLEDPNRLVMWEGQFGDFSNGAQVIIDQFISSGEQKWLRMSGLTMLLPHGYEGQGPEHSSARPERYLQLCDEDMFTIPADISDQAQKINMQVVNCTTPSNYFHVLRRQIHREYRKPLVVMTPKFLLNYIECRSPLSDFGPGQQFKRAIPEICEDRMAADNAVNKVIFCWGKVYFDLKKERERLYGNKPFEVAIVRLEEMAPFPFDKVLQQAQKYPNARVVWVQEEPQNQGAWTYALPRLHTATGQIPRYVGRPASAAPATGVTFIHKRELEHFLRDAFSC